jgi:hypothetical protein
MSLKSSEGFEREVLIMQLLKDLWFKFRQLKTWIQVLIVFTLFGLVGSFAGGGTTTSSTNSGTTTRTQASSSPTPEESVEATPEETKPAVSEKELKSALAKLRVKKDEVKNIKWYYDKTSPRFVNYNGFYLYMGREGEGEPWLRLKIQYAGEDWLFIESYYINVDGETFQISPSYGEIERDNDSTVWEWYDATPSSTDLYMLQKIANSKKTVMRIEGRQYYKDVTITQTQKNAIRNILTAYQGFGGSL